jgi:formyl-CoA transferase
MTAPLDGIVVADFSRVLAGPLATMTLADLGAMVVKVERPGAGDETRSWGPPWTADGTAAYFDGINRTKYSIALDLDDPADRETAMDLARRADVLVHNLKADRFGLDYEAISRMNPAVVYCEITGFGPTTDLPGYDFLVQAVGGLMSITGEADGEPLKVGVALVDVLTAKDATIGILAALRNRDRTGRGDHVQVNLLSSLLGGLVNQASNYLATGVPPRRMGNRHPSIAPYETFRAADGDFAVAVGNDAIFARLCEAIGRPELATDERFATNVARLERREQLGAILEGAFDAAPAAEWVQRLSAAGVPAGPINDIAQAFDFAQALGLDPVWETEGVRTVRSPMRLGDTPAGADRPPPALGEHDAELRAWLEAES